MNIEQEHNEPTKYRPITETPQQLNSKRFGYDEVLMYGIAATFATGCAAIGTYEGMHWFQNSPQTFAEVIQRAIKAVSLSVGAGGTASASWVTVYTLVRPLSKED